MELVYDIDLWCILIIALCVLSQSLFGVGVLLWGTPALMLYGLSYVDVLNLLLPISLCISVSQVFVTRGILSFGNARKFLVLCFPYLVLGLLLVLVISIDPTLFVILALILAGVLRLTNPSVIKNKITRKKDILLPLVGLTHGLSNLGGSMLVVWASFTGANRFEIRALVALLYTFLALSQILVILLTLNEFILSVMYIPPLLLLHVVSSKYVLRNINEEKYQNLLTVLIFAISILLSFRFIGIL